MHAFDHAHKHPSSSVCIFDSVLELNSCGQLQLVSCLRIAIAIIANVILSIYNSHGYNCAMNPIIILILIIC